MIPNFGSAFLVAMGWVVAGFLGAIPIVLLIRWWSEGYIAGSEFIGIAFMFIVLFALLMGPIPMAAKVIVFILLAASSAGVPYIVAALSKRDVRSFEEEKEINFRAAIEANPGNVAARGELARNLYARGRRSEAIEEMERAIRISPKTTENDQIQLKRWIHERDTEPKAIMVCRWCRKDTPKDRPLCVHCERPTSAVREVSEAVMEDMPDTIRLFLKLIPAMLIAAFIASQLQGIAGALVILILVVASMFWFRSRLA